MTKEEALQMFRDTGALLEGHFILRSGLHSRQFFQCALALQQMPVVEQLGAALAGVSGVIDGPLLAVNPDMGTDVLIQSFVVIVIGGVGSFGGAVIGGLIAGEIISLTSIFAPDYAQVLLYVAMAAVLILRPQGLLGVEGRA